MNSRLDKMINDIVQKKLQDAAEAAADRIVEQILNGSQTGSLVRGHRGKMYHPIRFSSTAVISVAKGNPYGRGRAHTFIDVVYRKCVDLLAQGPASRRVINEVLRGDPELKNRQFSVPLSKLLKEGSLVASDNAR